MMNATILQQHHILNRMQSIIVKVEDLGFFTQSLSKLLEFIANKMALTLSVEPSVTNKLEEECQGLPIHGSFTLEELLHLALQSQNLSYSFQGQKLHISCFAEGTASSLEIYPVGDLVALALEKNFDNQDEIPYQEHKNYEVFGLNFEEAQTSSAYYSESMIAELIREKILINQQYDLPKTAITSMPGKLYISHLPHIHQGIKEFLAQLRHLTHYPLSVEYGFVAFKSNFFKQSNLTFQVLHSQTEERHSLLYSILQDKEEMEFFADVEGSRDSDLLSQEHFNMRHLQTKLVVKANHTDYLADSQWQPGVKTNDVIGRMYEGVISKVRPQIHENVKEVSLLVDIAIATIAKPIPAFSVPGGEVALPNQTIQKVSTEIRIPFGSTLLLAGLSNPYEEVGKKSFNSNKKENLMMYFKVNLL